MTDLHITIDDMVFQKIMHWVNREDYEVSGFGNVVVKPDGALHVVEAIMLPQENTGSTTDIEAEHITKAMFQMHKQKAPGEMRWWWHSHVMMDVFWSGTDRGTINELASQGWFCATVFNQKEEMRSAYAQAVSLACSPDERRIYMLDDIDTYIKREFDEELLLQWDAEYDENVEIRRYTQQTSRVIGVGSSVGSKGGGEFGRQGHWWDEFEDDIEDEEPRASFADEAQEVQDELARQEARKLMREAYKRGEVG